jgi:UDP-N-acetylglucosamine 2-epimerase (non-hydrolysing)
MAPLVHAFKANPAFETIVCVTAQHRQMLDQVLNIFEITPDIDLNLMRARQDLFDVTSAVLLGMREVLKTHKPDAVLVHGDTTTAYATATAAFYAGIPVGHVEAGLRTHNILSPFPEEFNRQVVSKIATWHFAPTESSRQNLLDERTPDQNITVTGNTVIDALFWVLKRIEDDPAKRSQLETFLNQRLPFAWATQRFVLITGHRRENFGDGFERICQALKTLSERPDVQIVYPVHLNPSVQEPVRRILGNARHVHLIEPQDYLPFVYLMTQSYLIITDSGGVQEEAPSLGIPVLVMRDTTERPEGVTAGTAKLIGTDKDRIISEICTLLDDDAAYSAMARAHNPFGDGYASRRIAEIVWNARRQDHLLPA